MKTKDVMKLYKVRERTVRRWVERKCPCTKDENGHLVFDAAEVAQWRINQWTKEA